MKILFFVLGSIESRITSWGIDSFKTILEQDIIFYGPIPDDKFVFKGKEIPIIKIWNETGIDELLKALPAGWYPDIVTCETSVINLIPDIYKCPIKTYLLARDAWVDTMYNKGIVELFDFVRYSGIDRESYLSFNPDLMPLSGVSTFIEDLDIKKSDKKFKDRKIDVIAIANYHRPIYHTRHKLFYKLAKNIPADKKVKFIINISRNEINNYYKQAKIIIDWSFILANRTYEAAINGCLLFSHEDNKVIEQIWEPWVEYVPFNDSNLISLIEYYTKHIEESEKIISNALMKLNVNPISFGDSILKHLQQAIQTVKYPAERIENLALMDETILYHRLSTPLYFNYHFSQYNVPNNWKELYFQRIGKAINADRDQEDQTLLMPLIEASRMAFLLKKYELAQEYIIKLKSIFPNYAWTYYIYGKVLFELEEYQFAEENFEKAISIGENNPELLSKYILPFAEKNNVCDQRRVMDYLWQSSYNGTNEYQVNAFYNLCYSALGDLFLIKKNNRKAIEFYSKANAALPISTSINKVCSLYLDSKQFANLHESSIKGLDDSPYDNKLFIYRIIALIKLNRKKEARLIIKDEIKILKCFERNKRAKKLNLIYQALVIFLIFEKRITLSVLLSILKRL